MRACRELDVATVAVYSEADQESLHVRFADEAVCIGPAQATQSYLKVSRIVAAAEITGAEAVHPGYGFLAENAEFAEICERSDLVFVGPTPDQIRTMGDKAVARETMRAAGVPVVPGSDGIVDDEQEALARAREIGFPIMIKAAAGGGGKGMRIAADEGSFLRHFASARAEAGAAFGEAGVYLERCLIRPRHIEFQVFGDKHGRVVHVGERDCSIQRRHQKLVEEAPSPGSVAGASRADGRSGRRGGARHQLRRLRHGGVPARRRGRFLLHRDEHPHPGRAHGHRGGHRP